MREKLIEILRKPIFPHELVDPAEAVADYLLDNGVIVPPCKVGDTVYSTLDDLVRLHKCKVCGIYKGRRERENYVELESVSDRGRLYGATFGSFGKTVFLTREEAEAALKEVQG